jgi:hypothetical protein
MRGKSMNGSYMRACDNQSAFFKLNFFGFGRFQKANLITSLHMKTHTLSPLSSRLTPALGRGRAHEMWQEISVPSFDRNTECPG